MNAISLKEFNHLTEPDAVKVLAQCCSATKWVNLMVAGRPFPTIAALKEAAQNVWANLKEEDYLEAFEGHPKIGDINSLRTKYASTKALAVGEQSSVGDADETTLHALAEGNKAYAQRNGFIFIVFATGKSALQILALLQTRLKNSRAQEVAIAAGEQAKITALRIEKLIEESTE